MSEHGTDTCIECGEHGDRLLPARFPHICVRCLFPSQRSTSAMLSDLYAKVIHTRAATPPPSRWSDST